MSTNHKTIGIELGDRRHTVCVLSAGGHSQGGAGAGQPHGHDPA